MANVIEITIATPAIEMLSIAGMSAALSASVPTPEVEAFTGACLEVEIGTPDFEMSAWSPNTCSIEATVETPEFEAYTGGVIEANAVIPTPDFSVISEMRASLEVPVRTPSISMTVRHELVAEINTIIRPPSILMTAIVGGLATIEPTIPTPRFSARAMTGLVASLDLLGVEVPEIEMSAMQTNAAPVFVEVFQDDFETGSASGDWDGFTGSVYSVAEIGIPAEPGGGNFVAVVEAGQGGYKTLEPEDEYWFETEVYISADDAGGQETVQLWVWNWITYEQVALGTSLYAVDTWHQIKGRVKAGEGTGECQIWVNDVLEVDETGLNLGIDRITCLGIETPENQQARYFGRFRAIGPVVAMPAAELTVEIETPEILMLIDNFSTGILRFNAEKVQ